MSTTLYVVFGYLQIHYVEKRSCSDEKNIKWILNNFNSHDACGVYSINN